MWLRRRPHAGIHFHATPAIIALYCHRPALSYYRSDWLGSPTVPVVLSFRLTCCRCVLDSKIHWIRSENLRWQWFTLSVVDCPTAHRGSPVDCDMPGGTGLETRYSCWISFSHCGLFGPTLRMFVCRSMASILLAAAQCPGTFREVSTTTCSGEALLVMPSLHPWLTLLR